jgi:protocatechuate 3,4-dioxygenase beta subunit
MKMRLLICLALVLLAGGIFGWLATKNTRPSKQDAVQAPQDTLALPEPAQPPPAFVKNAAPAHPTKPPGSNSPALSASGQVLDDYGDPVRYWRRNGTNLVPMKDVPPIVRKIFPEGAYGVGP